LVDKGVKETRIEGVKDTQLKISRITCPSLLSTFTPSNLLTPNDQMKSSSSCIFK